jgi:hypothetical protein
MNSWKDEYTEKDVERELEKLGLAAWMRKPNEFTVWMDGTWRFTLKLHGVNLDRIISLRDHFRPTSMEISVSANGELLIDLSWIPDD